MARALRIEYLGAVYHVREELENMGWQPIDLDGRAKGDPGKVRIARRIRQETTVTLKWIAEQLHMGTWTHVSNFLQPGKEGNGPEKQMGIDLV